MATIGAQIKLDKGHLPLFFPDLWLVVQSEENGQSRELKLSS